MFLLKKGKQLYLHEYYSVNGLMFNQPKFLKVKQIEYIYIHKKMFPLLVNVEFSTIFKHKKSKYLKTYFPKLIKMRGPNSATYKLCFRYFPKGILPRATSPVTISQVATSQMYNSVIGNFAMVR